MANINDAYYSVLSGYSGSVDDRRSALLTNVLGYTNPMSLNDMERSVLAILGYTGSLDDAWSRYLKVLGGNGLESKADLLSSTFYGSPIPLFFINSPQGVWYDPSDLTTLFQDSAGTTPVTAAGQTVGRILDKSGNGYHATQATLAQRPTYQIDANNRPYLSFDGVDDNLVIPSMTMTGTEQLFFCFGAQRLSTTSVTMLMTFGKGGASTTYPGFALAVRGSSSPSYAPQLQTASTTANNNLVATLGSSFGDAATRVLSATRTALRVNSSALATSGATINFSGWGTQNNRLGCNYNFANNNFWKGNIYSVIFIASTVTSGQIITAERWVNSKTGAY